MLAQDEAESLIAMEKRFNDTIDFLYLPEPGHDLVIPLVSVDGRESFLLDIEHGRLPHPQRGDSSSDKWKLQLRYGDEVLVRLDIGGPAHINPGRAPHRRLSRYAGRRIPTPHIQRYIEGQEDEWALPPPPDFTALSDITVTWREFIGYCSIIETPNIMGDF